MSLFQKLLVGGVVAGIVGSLMGSNALVLSVPLPTEAAPRASGDLPKTQRPQPSPKVTERDASKPTMREAQRLALAEVDPQMKAASDLVGLIINLSGHLCARVSNVEPAGGSKFEVTCVERRSGTGRVRYLVDGQNNTAVPL